MVSRPSIRSPKETRPAGRGGAIARACIRDGARGRFFNVVDLINKLEAEGRAGRQGRVADYLCRMRFIVLDELIDSVAVDPAEI